MVGFYDISTIVGYLSQILFVQIYKIYMICKHVLLITISNEPGVIFLSLKYFYLIRITLFTVYHLFAHRGMVSSIAI